MEKPMANSKNNTKITPVKEGTGKTLENKKTNAVQLAHQQADADIAADPEASAHSPNDDLDEGELARLGENGNPIQ